jgi:uncharacterized protein (DUF1697 family)
MTHVAFLRAVNVGGRGVVKMADLQRAFETAGARDARTVIASGNVVFETAGPLGPIRERIQQKVKTLLGADPVILFRTHSYLEDLIEAAPFGALATDRNVKLYVAFLAGKPRQLPRFPLHVEKEALDVRGLYKQDALIVSYKKPNGFYGFPGGWTEQELGVASTARNWSTVTRIVKRPT